MLKTLKITGIIAAALAVVFLVFSAVFGARGNDDIENFLDSPGAVENFKKAYGNKQKKDQDQTSPLVKQAQKFALFLDPPVAPRRTTSVRTTGTPSVPARPKTVSAKFKLIGTSFYPTNPEMSLALIDEPGKGFRWVRQSGKVGHLIIQQIKDGLVVVKDDQRTFEMTPQRQPKKSLIRNKLTTPPKTGQKPPIPLSIKNNTSTKSNQPNRPRQTEDNIMLQAQEFLKIMQQRQLDANSETPLQPLNEQNKAAMDKLLSNIQNMQINDQEAKHLDDLGQKLAENHQPANEPNSQNDEIE
jgi:hypothetical protein